MSRTSSAAGSHIATSTGQTPLDKARAARKAMAGSNLEMSADRKFALRQLQTLASVARLAVKKLRAGGTPASATIEAFAATAIASIKELHD